MNEPTPPVDPFPGSPSPERSFGPPAGGPPQPFREPQRPFPPFPPRTHGSGTSPLFWIGLAIALVLLAGSVFLNVALLMVVAVQSAPSGGRNLAEKRIQGKARDKVLVIDVAGLISRGGSVLFFPAEDVVEHVKARLAFAENERIKAVIIRVDSPGGTVTASDDIYKAIMEFKKKTGKPVISLMGDTAASGGYYVSMACDRIVAHEATLTGSIGVIMQFLNYKGLFDKHGLRWQTFTPADADLKSIGSGDREITEKERAVFQSMVEEMYELFLARVQAGRKDLTPVKVRELADGRPYTGKQAHAAGLVDVLGGLEEAIAEARKIKSFDTDPTVIQMKTVTPFSDLFSASSSARQPSASLEEIGRSVHSVLGARFYYLYQQ